MELQNSKVSVEITSAIAKIDQLLRLYQMSKKTDPSKKTIVQKKVNDLINTIKADPIYPKIQQFLAKKVQASLDDPKVVTKVQRQSSGISSIKSPSNPSQQRVIISDASISGNNSASESNSKNKVQSRPSIQTVDINQKSSSDNNYQSPSGQSIQSSSQMSNDKSEDNGFLILLDNLRSICHQNQGKVEQILAFNEDVFTLMKQVQDKNSMVYLFGVNNPQKKNIKKLYICTLMQFSSYQIANCHDNNGEFKFHKQNKMFENSLRSPMGLILCGKTIDDISIQHVRFLAQMKSPLGVIILLNSFKQKNGVLYEFSGDTLKMAKDLNKVEYEQKTSQLRKQYGTKAKNIAPIEVVKDKLVITKNLTRTITSAIESAQNAIQIESSNQCIKQQPNRFPYKLHTKYFVSSKSDYQLFFLDNQLIAFKMNFKEKDFDSFKKYTLSEAHHQGNFLMSTSVLKQTSQIKKEFWRLLVQCKTRDQYFLVNFSGITNKKTIILSLKQNVTEDQIMNAEPFLFKDLQKSTDIINVVAVLTKSNYKQFETESKVEVIDLTQKKK